MDVTRWLRLGGTRLKLHTVRVRLAKKLKEHCQGVVRQGPSNIVEFIYLLSFGFPFV